MRDLFFKYLLKCLPEYDMILYKKRDINGLVWADALWTTVGGKNFPPFFTGPIIRREDVFEGYSIDDRRKLI